MNNKYLVLLLATIPFWLAWKEELPKQDDDDDKNVTIDWNAAANDGSNALINSFWNANGQYFNTDNNGNTSFQYWPNAHALDVLIDAYLRTNDATYSSYFEKWFVGVKARNGNSWNNDYYDDMEWNALALLRAWKATGDVRYKDATLELWGYIKQGWNEQAGGGITWKKGMEYSKNACSMVQPLYWQQDFTRSLEIRKIEAIKIYNWLKSTLVNTNNGMVYDNIDANTG